MITVTDAHALRFLMVNRAAERIFERPREELVAGSVFDALPECEASQLFGRNLDLLNGTDPLDISEHVVHSPSGKRRVLRTKKLPISTSLNGPQHLLTISEDITAKTQAVAWSTSESPNLFGSSRRNFGFRNWLIAIWKPISNSSRKPPPKRSMSLV